MSRIENDAFFTPDNVALACVEDFYKEMPEYRNNEIVEPSAGGGAFLRAFEKLNLKYEAYDLNPQADNIVQADYLSTELDLTGKVVLGNPPYGFRSKLTNQFIKRSFEQGAEAVGFLLFGGILSHSSLKRIGYEILYYKRLNDFSFIDKNGNCVLDTSTSIGFKPIFIIFGKKPLQNIEKVLIEYGTLDSWTFFANNGGIRERQNETATIYEYRHGYRKVLNIVSSDSKRVSHIFNINEGFEKRMYEDLMWICFSGRIPPGTVSFHASYPELNKGWIILE